MEMRQVHDSAGSNPSRHVLLLLLVILPLHLRLMVAHVVESSDRQALCPQVRHARPLVKETEHDVLFCSIQRCWIAVSTVSLMWRSSTSSACPTLRTTFLAGLRPTQRSFPHSTIDFLSFVHTLTRKGGLFPWPFPGLSDPFIRVGAYTVVFANVLTDVWT